MQTFYKGLTTQTRSYVDSAAGGGIMNKTLDEAFELIESMACHNFSWTNERVNHSPPGMYSLTPSDNVAAQVEILNKQMAIILSSSKSLVNEQVNFYSSSRCEICGDPSHQTVECKIFSVEQPHVSEVNYAQNSPYSHNYNPNRRNHPNFSYKNNPSRNN
jgi:hypothetical protein